MLHPLYSPEVSPLAVQKLAEMSHLTIREEVVSATSKKLLSGDISNPFGINNPLTSVRVSVVLKLNETNLPRPVASRTAYLLSRLVHFHDESVKYNISFSPTATSFKNLTGIPSTAPSCGKSVVIFLLWMFNLNSP